MKTKSLIVIVFGTFIVAALCAVHLACSPGDEQRFAASNPQLAPATQALESIQHKVDQIADKTQQAASIVQNAANGAAGLGVPGASTVALIAGVLGTIVGIYKERRTGTAPLMDAFEQVVSSVEEAFPNKTDQQKASLASAQDQATKALVAKVKSA